MVSEMFERHSAIAHATYHELLRSFQNDAASDIRGTPIRVESNGKTY